MKAYRFNKQKEFEIEIECQIDPLETKKQGKEIWLLPANSTFKKPLEQKNGCLVCFNGENWEYVKIPLPPEPTEEEKKKIKITELKGFLAAADYWGQKYIDGEYTPEEWEEKKAQRKAWREEIRSLENCVDSDG